MTTPPEKEAEPKLVTVDKQTLLELTYVMEQLQQDVCTLSDRLNALVENDVIPRLDVSQRLLSELEASDGDALGILNLVHVSLLLSLIAVLGVVLLALY